MSTPFPVRRRLVLMRHGEVQYFDPHARRPAAPEGVPLTERGRHQADAAGALLRGVRLDRIVCSGLPRTRETAERVRQACDGPAVEDWPALQEIRGGRLSAHPPEALPQLFAALHTGPFTPDTRFLGGETLGEVAGRVLPALQRLRDAPDWDTVLVVAHGVVNALWLSHFVSGGHSLLLPGWQQNPACLNLIDLGPQTGQDLLRAVNLNPIDWLQTDDRRGTMEHLYDDFMAWRREQG